MMPTFLSEENPFDRFAEEYDNWYDINKELFTQELNAVLNLKLQPEHYSIEIGGGTGRFASALGIDFVLDPSLRALKIALKRGLKTVAGDALNLPLKKGKIKRFYLIFSLCFIQKFNELLAEIRKVCQAPEIVIVFINRNSKLGQKYKRKKDANKFYRFAQFFSAAEIKHILHHHRYRIAHETYIMDYGIGIFYIKPS